MEQQKKQSGAVIVEASLALPFFMFAIYIMLSIIQMAYAQTRMAVALDAAAKQLAEYTHIYFVLGADEVFTGKGGVSSGLANDVATFLQELGDGLGNLDTEFGGFVSDTGQALQGDSITAILQNMAGEAIGKQLLKKNLADGPGDNGDAFMKRNRIQNVNMDGSKFLEAGEGSTGRDVFLRVNYDIEVVRLLNMDFQFHMSHCAYTVAWAGEDK